MKMDVADQKLLDQGGGSGRPALKRKAPGFPENGGKVSQSIINYINNIYIV